MAGQGYKDFTNGQVADASEADGYLMQQTIMRFTSAAARDTALSGVMAEGSPANGTYAFTRDTGDLWQFDGTGWRKVIGPRAYVDSTGNSAAVGAEAVVLTSPTMTFVDGRCYEWRFFGRINASAGNITTFRVHQTNLAGAVKAQNLNFLATAASQGLVAAATGYIRRTAGSNLVDNLVLTMQASAGTSTMIGAADSVRFFEVREVGAAVDYANAITI